MLVYETQILININFIYATISKKQLNVYATF